MVGGKRTGLSSEPTTRWATGAAFSGVELALLMTALPGELLPLPFTWLRNGLGGGSGVPAFAFPVRKGLAGAAAAAAAAAVVVVAAAVAAVVDVAVDDDDDEEEEAGPVKGLAGALATAAGAKLLVLLFVAAVDDAGVDAKACVALLVAVVDVEVISDDDDDVDEMVLSVVDVVAAEPAKNGLPGGGSWLPLCGKFALVVVAVAVAENDDDVIVVVVVAAAAEEEEEEGPPATGRRSGWLGGRVIKSSAAMLLRLAPASSPAAVDVRPEFEPELLLAATTPAVVVPGTGKDPICCWALASASRSSGSSLMKRSKPVRHYKIIFVR
jgi:hypothetical protein